MNMGSLFTFYEDKAAQMAEALAKVLSQHDDIQVIWKFRKEGAYDETRALAPLQRYEEKGRVKIKEWLEVDPATLLQSGYIDLFVNHGGGNSYHEAI